MRCTSLLDLLTLHLHSSASSELLFVLLCRGSNPLHAD